MAKEPKTIWLHNDSGEHVRFKGVMLYPQREEIPDRSYPWCGPSPAIYRTVGGTLILQRKEEGGFGRGNRHYVTILPRDFDEARAEIRKILGEGYWSKAILKAAFGDPDTVEVD